MTEAKLTFLRSEKSLVLAENGNSFSVAFFFAS
jgi:hypothetical protein